VLDEQGDDQQAIITYVTRLTRSGGIPESPYTVVAGQQMTGWDTFEETASLIGGLEGACGNDSGEYNRERDVFEGDGFRVIRGGPMRDPMKTGKGLSAAERKNSREENERQPQEAAKRVSDCIDSPYIARTWTSLNTVARLSEQVKTQCKLMVLTCPLTPQSKKHWAGWNMEADMSSWHRTHEFCVSHRIPLVLLRGRYLNCEADHQMAFDKGEDGHEQLLEPSFRMHPHDKAAFVRTKDKVMREHLEQMCGALSFLRGSETMIRPEFKEGSSLNRFISEDAWTAG
jgi:hypothetical protein